MFRKNMPLLKINNWFAPMQYCMGKANCFVQKNLRPERFGFDNGDGLEYI